MIVTLRKVSEGNKQRTDVDVSVEVNREDLPGGVLFEAISTPENSSNTHDRLTVLAMDTLKKALDLIK